MTVGRCAGLVASVLLIAAAISLLFVSDHAVAQNGGSVAIGDNFFNPTPTTVTVGATVTWTNGGLGQHTVTGDSGLFDSGQDQTQYVNPGQTFSFAFTKAGTYGYHCVLHGAAGGVGMSGTIVVEAVATAAPTAPPETATPAPSAEPSSNESAEATRPALVTPSTTAKPSVTTSPALTSLPTSSATPGLETTSGSGGTDVWVLVAVGAVVIGLGAIGLGAIGAVFYTRR